MSDPRRTKGTGGVQIRKTEITLKNILSESLTRCSRRGERRPTGCYASALNEASFVEALGRRVSVVVGRLESEVYLSEAQHSVPVLSHDSG